MKKPIGITVSAVFALLGSLLILGCLVLVGVSMLLSPTPRPLPPEARFGIVFGVVMFGIMGAWGTTTAIGLFRLRNWARISMIVFAALLAFAALSAAPMMFLIPPPPTAPPNYNAVRIALAVFYGALGLLGIFWLYYFSRRTAREAFAATSAGGVVVESGGRPLSISIIGWWFLVCGIIGVLAFPFKMPASMFIWILSGWTAAIFQIAFGAIWIYVGYGLLCLNPTARKIAIALISFGAANVVVNFVVPGRDARFATLMSHFHFFSQSPLPPHFPVFMLIPMAAAFALPLWFLITRGTAFQVGELDAVSNTRGPQATA